MARRELFKKLNNPSSDIPLRPFDISQRKLFSARAGMCIPTLALECQKGDKFRINTTVFNRTDRLLAPAFFRCKQVNHYFFVPYHTLWHEWDSFYTRSTEKLSAATLGSSYFPNFNWEQFTYAVENNTGSIVGNDMLGFDGRPGIDRMLQMLHYGSMDSMDVQVYDQMVQAGTAPSHYCNLARILAYNKIWYWYYRDKRHNPSANWFQSFVNYYNVDDVNCSTFANSHLDVSSQLPRLIEMFKPKYRTWDSDVFSNSFASTQFGNVSVLNSENIQIQLSNPPTWTTSTLAGARIGFNQSGGVTYAQSRASDGSIIQNGQYFNIPNLFDIIQLRRAEAVQHWSELMLRAGDSSKDRYRAMFGSNPKRSEEIPNYIGGFDVNLNIDDVTSNSIDFGQGTDGLGQLAGKGIMVNQNDTINFTSPDFGILMCITSILPLAEYDGNCIDKGNTLIEPTDFFIPQFDRLGFEPVTLSERSTKQTLFGQYSWETVLGYTVRNHYLKTAVDRVYNNFRAGKSEAYWTCVRNPQLLANPALSYSLQYRDYYVDPVIINPLFDRSCNKSTYLPDSAYNEDQFKCMTYFDIKALRPMSELGLPPL